VDVGAQLRDARVRAGLSQTQLARRAGVPVSTVGRIERGEMSPTVQMLNRLAAAMGLRSSVSFSDGLLELVRANAGEVERTCARHGARHPRVFGSVARRDDDAGSDIDLMVDRLEEVVIPFRRTDHDDQAFVGKVSELVSLT
jgi:uncharacterized protein